MTYDEFRACTSFSQEHILSFGHGTLIDDPPAGFRARLPAPPMLMVDRVTEITRKGNRGRIVAERDVRIDDWFFQCHFLGDPVQPGCLGVDAVWQLIGFYCVWTGALGAGRALGCGEIEFAGQIRPHDQLVRYQVDIVRLTTLPASGATIAIADAVVSVDNEPIYWIKRAKTGVFRNIDYPDYPRPSARSRGGRLADD